jgi:hypothetical protein
MLLCRAGMLTLPVFSPDLSQIRVSRPLVFCAVFCRLRRIDNTTEKETKEQTIISKALHRIQSLSNTNLKRSNQKPYIKEGQTIQQKKKKDKNAYSYILVGLCCSSFMFFCVAYYMSLRCEFHVVISVTISA